MPFFAQKRLISGLFWAKNGNFIKTKKGYPVTCISFPIKNFIGLFFYSFNVFPGFCIHPYQFAFIYK